MEMNDCRYGSMIDLHCVTYKKVLDNINSINKHLDGVAILFSGSQNDLYTGKSYGFYYAYHRGGDSILFHTSFATNIPRQDDR